MTRGVKGSTPSCKEPGCEKKAKAYGMCKSHWRRWRRENGVRCSVDGCDSEVNGNGMCAAHYSRWRLYGNAFPEIAIQQRSQNVSPTRLRFFLRLNWAEIESEASCWLWAGACADGYPMLRNNGGPSDTAHRFSYERFMQEIPDGWHVDHLCGNRHCVNPQHLEAVPRQVNILRGMADSIRAEYGEERLRQELEWLAQSERGSRRQAEGGWNAVAA